MTQSQIDRLITQHRTGALSRRGFVRQATALGLSATAAGALAHRAAAQDATPAASPGAGTDEVTRSITREEYNALLRETFQFEEPQQQGGLVIQVNSTDIRALNPHLVTDVYSGYITGFVFENLAVGSPIDGTPVPGLADYWELAADGITYTFYLNPNAMWHDGQPVTADDVVFSFDTTLAEDSLSIRRATVQLALASYRAVDDHTVELVSNGPRATFIQDTVFQVSVIPRHIWEGVPNPQWGGDPGNTGQDPSRVVGSGPFTFVEWVQGDHVTMRRNDNHWDTQNLPVIDEYTYRVVADAQAALQSLRTGESDIFELPTSQVEPLRQTNPELVITEFDTTGFNYYYGNQDPSVTELFTEIPLRQALHYALDRDLIAETIYQGFAIRADGTQPVLSLAYRPEEIETIYTYDPAMSAQLLDGIGWVVGDDGIRQRDGVRLSFEMLYSEGSATYEQQIPYMQQAWREIGVEMIPAAIPFPTLIDQVNAGTFEAAIAGFSWGVDGSQGDMYRCDAAPPGGFNRMRYCNPQYDELDAAAATELDQERRIEILVEASNIVNNEVANGVVVFSRSIFGSQPRLHNFLPNGYSDLWSLPYVWVEQ